MEDNHENREYLEHFLEYLIEFVDNTDVSDAKNLVVRELNDDDIKKINGKSLYIIEGTFKKVNDKVSRF